LGGGCLCLIPQDVVFSENETGRGRQVVLGPFQKGCLVLNPSIGSWIVVMMVSVSLGRVFGELKFH
jgi:hypothetical protein